MKSSKCRQRLSVGVPWTACTDAFRIQRINRYGANHIEDVKARLAASPLPQYGAGFDLCLGDIPSHVYLAMVLVEMGWRNITPGELWNQQTIDRIISNHFP